MLGIFVTIVLVLWLIGMVTSNTFGGFLHVLLACAVIIYAIRLLTGREIA
jgi:uncharacterized membrane protein